MAKGRSSFAAFGSPLLLIGGCCLALFPIAWVVSNFVILAGSAAVCDNLRTYLLVEGIGFCVWSIMVCGLPCLDFTPNTPWLVGAAVLAVAQGVYSFVAISFLVNSSKDQCGASLWSMGVADATLSGLLGAFILLWVPLAIVGAACDKAKQRRWDAEREARKNHAAPV